jgi:hypothetical protein
MAAATPPVAFLSRKKRGASSGTGFSIPSNQSTSLFNTGTLHLSNCSVTVLSLDPALSSSRGANANGNGNNNVTVASTAAGASRSLAAGAGGRNTATSLDLLVGEAIQTIGASSSCVLDSMDSSDLS